MTRAGGRGHAGRSSEPPIAAAFPSSRCFRSSIHWAGFRTGHYRDRSPRSPNRRPGAHPAARDAATHFVALAPFDVNDGRDLTP